MTAVPKICQKKNKYNNKMTKKKIKILIIIFMISLRISIIKRYILFRMKNLLRAKVVIVEVNQRIWSVVSKTCKKNKSKKNLNLLNQKRNPWNLLQKRKLGTYKQAPQHPIIFSKTVTNNKKKEIQTLKEIIV